MASGSSLGATNADAPADTAQLDKFCDKALTAGLGGRYALSATCFQRAADLSLRLNEETFVCTYLTLQRSAALLRQAHLEGVTPPWERRRTTSAFLSRVWLVETYSDTERVFTAAAVAAACSWVGAHLKQARQSRAKKSCEKK